MAGVVIGRRRRDLYALGNCGRRARECGRFLHVEAFGDERPPESHFLGLANLTE